MTYRVIVQEVWTRTVKIEADSPEQALSLVDDGDGERLDDTLHYSYTLDPEFGWQVCSVSDEGIYGAWLLASNLDI